MVRWWPAIEKQTEFLNIGAKKREAVLQCKVLQY